MKAALAAILAAALAGAAPAAAQTVPETAAAAAPAYRVDPFWPKPLPNNWRLGQSAGVAVGPDDHVWVFQRPGSLTEDERAASFDPPRARCCVPAPPVIEFDPSGAVVRAWGGPGQGYEWFQNEHGLFVDAEGHVWLTGNGEEDGHILKFAPDGRFVLQIGRRGPPTHGLDVQRLGRPADVFVDTAAREVFVADGYRNRRVIVFDSVTGAFKRQWGAYGRPPAEDAPPDPATGRPGRFDTVHCVGVAADGLVYVCDRTHNRIQVFRRDGTFVRESVQAPETIALGSVWDLALQPGGAGPLLFNADGANNEVRVLDRRTDAVLSAFGRAGRQAGDLHWVHAVAVDSKGAVYTGEVDTGKRVQRFVPAP